MHATVGLVWARRDATRSAQVGLVRTNGRRAARRSPWAHCTARQCWVRIPGKHRTKDAAWEAFQEKNLMTTRLTNTTRGRARSAPGRPARGDRHAVAPSVIQKSSRV